MILIVVGAAGFAASWAGMDVSLSRATTAALSSTGHNRSWAPLPEEVPMPAAAPDDPAAYRGVRFEIDEVRGRWPSAKVGGRAVPWLRVIPAGYSAADVYGVYFGDVQVFDGRRWMVWFNRLVESPAVTPDPSVGASPYPPMAVLDVVVLPGESREEAGPRISRACGPDGDDVIILGDDGWRLNRRTGRIGPFDLDDVCWVD
jgi:hypothetical protein